MFHLEISKNRVNLKEREVLVSGASKSHLVQFAFSSDWEGLNRNAVFRAGEVSRSEVLSHTNQCHIPWEVLEMTGRILWAGVEGTDGEGLVLPTVWCALGCISPGAHPGDDEAQPPTPDVYSQLLAVANKAAETAKSVRDDADAGKFDGADGKDGVDGKDGAPGADGADAPQIEDEAVTATNPWSSKNIVDRLCPAFSVSGNPVTCQPVEGYPLGVQVSWEPTQEGEGDPSPDNVRPISGWDAANLWVGGENLWKGPSGYTVAENSVYTNYTDAETVAAVNALPRGVPLYFSASWDYSTGGTEVVWLGSVVPQHQLKVKNNTEITIPQGAVYDAIRVYAGGNKTQDATVTDFMFSAGASTTYTPYNPASRTITLPFGQTVYGGTLDWITGVLTVGWISHTFNAADSVSGNWQSTDTSMGAVIAITSPGATPVQTTGEIPNILCASLKTISYGNIFSGSNSDTAISLVWGGKANQFVIRLPLSLAETAADIKSWLIDNAVEVVYQIAEPFTIQLTPQEILALSATNTIYTDGDSVTVSGRADSLATIQAMQEQIAALTQHIAEGGTV